MANDEKRRPTPRKKAKAAAAPKPSKARAPKAPKASKAPARQAPKSPLRAPVAKAAARDAKAVSTGSTPAFLERGARAARAKVASRQQRSNSPRERRERYQRGVALRYAAIAAGVLAAVAAVLLVAFLILRNSSMFEITSVEVEPTEHVSVEDVQNLAQVPAGSTLLNVDTASIEESLRKNPWVASVSFERVFPGTLKLHITEQHVDTLVVMSSGSVAWYLGDAGTWIQPAKIQPAEGQSVDDAALALAQASGCLLVIDVPSTVDPKSGSEASDPVLQSVNEFREGFSEEFSSRVVCYSAASTDDIWCMLDNGVEVSLGSATDIAEKEQRVTDYLEQYPDTALYIVVRVPSHSSVRTVDSQTVESAEGTSMFAGRDEAEAREQELQQQQQEESAQQSDEGQVTDDPQAEGEASPEGEGTSQDGSEGV